MIGDLGPGRPRLEMWLDRFTRSRGRRFWFGFVTETRRAQLQHLVDRASRGMGSPYRIADNDIQEDPYVRLTDPLDKGGFGRPVHETYRFGWYFYGVYVADPASTRASVRRLLALAPEFYERVARVWRHSVRSRKGKGTIVADESIILSRHLAHERSSFLATRRKVMDDFRCSVCSMQFQDVYGNLGINFAEAHHLVPLGQLGKRVRTTLEDLGTVCANCHRMLHRLGGKPDDVRALRRIVRRSRASGTGEKR